VREEGLVERSAEIGEFISQKLEKLATRHGMVREIRGRGLMQAAEFEADKKGFALRDVFDKLLVRGFLVGYKPAGNLLRFLPPF